MKWDRINQPEYKKTACNLTICSSMTDKIKTYANYSLFSASLTIKELLKNVLSVNRRLNLKASVKQNFTKIVLSSCCFPKLQVFFFPDADKSILDLEQL